MILGNGLKNNKEYIFMKNNKGVYKIVDAESNKTVYKTYIYKSIMNYFDNEL